MTAQICDVPECTFPQTGTCMKSYQPEDCPSHQAALARLVGDELNLDKPEITEGAPEIESQTTNFIGEAVLAAPDQKPSLPRSGTLGLHETDALMRSRYVNMIGIVGLPNAGKTACIASLYLLLAHSSMKGFSYLDSKTLMAFEEIARGTRRWNDGNAPTQMTSHTELADDRQAGFLHLRLKRNSDGHKFDLLMPDLPGEWSRTLITNSDSERFEFIMAAEVIWLMVNGVDFLEHGTREVAIHRMTNLIERLAAILPSRRPKIILVASWQDKGEFPEMALRRIQDYGKKFELLIDFAPIASFSDTDMPPGAGLAELIEETLCNSDVRPASWPANPRADSHREFLKFGTSL